MDTTWTEQRQEVALAIRMAERSGLFDMHGHISMRLPDGNQFLINSYGASRGSLGPGDIVRLDLDGNLLDGTDRPPSEWPLHAEILRARPDVGAVAHFHPQVATRFSISRRPLVPVCNLGAAVGAVAYFDKSDLVRSRELGAELAAALGEHRAVLMRGHGVTVVGRDLREAFGLSVCLEENARMLAGAVALGEPAAFSAADVERVGANLREPRAMKKLWDYHRSKLG